MEQKDIGLYQRFLTKVKGKKIKLFIEDNINSCGERLAIEIIRALQFWQNEPKIGIHLCTGSSPFIGYRKICGDKTLSFCYRKDSLSREYKKIGSILDTWWSPSTQALLRRYKIDPHLKPDMKKVIAFAVDAIFPQWGTDYYAFSNILGNVCDLWGIPFKNRYFFYSDIYVEKLSQGWRIRRIKEREFRVLYKSIHREGLKFWEYALACFLQGKREGFSLHTPLRIRGKKGYILLPTRDSRGRFVLKERMIKPLSSQHIQYHYLESMRNQALMMQEKLKELEGTHITILGVGPSSAGKGHIAFCEEGTLSNQTCFIAPINDYDPSFHIAASYAKELGGFKNMFVVSQKVRVPKYGFISYGPADFIYGKDKNKGYIIVIATGSKKRESIKKALEEGGRTPLTLLSKVEVVYILDKKASSRLRINLAPWEFKNLGKQYWQKDTYRCFINLAKAYNCKIAEVNFDLIKHKLVNEIYPDKELREEVLNNCAINFKYLKEELNKRGSQYSFKQELERIIEKNIILPYQIKDLFNKRGLKPKDKLLFINPHLDDVFLSSYLLLKELSPYFEIYVVATAPGYNAVDSNYLLCLLEVIKQLPSKELRNLSFKDKERIVKALIAEKTQAVIPPRYNYEVFSYMGEEEKVLRAKALFIDLNNPKNQFLGKRQIATLIRFLKEIERLREEGIFLDIEFIRYLKTSIRFTEELAALISLGLDYSNILWPLSLSCYSKIGRNVAIERRDISRIKKAILKIHPKLLIFNGEDLLNFNTHSNTEIGVKLALRELYEKGKLKNLLILQWAGVWERISEDKLPISIVIRKGELSKFYKEFNYFYRSQAPYGFSPHACVDKPQSFAQDVISNANTTVKVWASLITFKPFLKAIFNQGGGILNYRLRGLKDVIESLEELKQYWQSTKVNLTASSNQTLMGEPFYSPRLREINPFLLKSMSKFNLFYLKERKISGYADCFSLSSAQLLNIIEEFQQEMKKGLEGRSSSLAMLPTFVDIPFRREQGLFFALDWGGSTFRIVRVEIKGEAGLPQIRIRSYPLRGTGFHRRRERECNYTKGYLDTFLNVLIKYMQDFLKEREEDFKGRAGPYPLGLTFSFPVEQKAIDRAIVLGMSKEFQLKGIKNRDIVQLFREALKKAGLDRIFEIVSLNNDTTATLVAGRFFYRDCDVAGIVGTGTNFCYLEDCANITKLRKSLPREYNREKMVVNIESGNFNKVFSNVYDKILDRDSSNPGEHILEKMVSGLYLGELMRLVLVDLIEKGLIFDKLKKEEAKKVIKKYSFPTYFLSEIENDKSVDLNKIEEYLRRWAIKSSIISREDKKIVKDIAICISQRAARLTAAVIFAIVTYIDKNISYTHTVAIDGSLFQKHPTLSKEIKRTLKEISWHIWGEDRSRRVKLKLIKEASGLGAAIIAANAKLKSG